MRLRAKRFAVAAATCWALSTCAQTAQADESGWLFDFRGAYPWIPGPGPEDTTYRGGFVFGGRFGGYYKHFWVTFGVDHYWLSNDFQDRSLKGTALTFPLYWGYRLGSRDDDKPFDLLLGMSISGATRSFAGIEGSTGSVTIGMDAAFPLYPVRSANFFVAPDLEYTYIVEGEGSGIGSLNILSPGLRLGFHTN